MIHTIRIVFLAIIIAWIVVGISLVIITKSRGLKADILFVFTWPIIWYLDWRNGLL